MDARSDEMLVRQMAARDEAALVELHRRYAPYLAAVARRMLRDPDEVQQSVQDAFVRAWEAADRFDPAQASAKTWLVTIAHRLVLNRIRGAKAVLMPLESWDAPTAPPDHLARIELYGALSKLEEEERELIELAFFEGHSHRQLAELTGKPLGTVKTKLRTALGKLRETLGGEP